MNDDREALSAGLNQLRERGPRCLIAKHGSTRKNIELRLSATDAAMLELMQTMGHLITHRPVSKALLIRRGIALAADHLASTLRDPVKAAAEKAELRRIQRGEA